LFPWDFVKPEDGFIVQAVAGRNPSELNKLLEIGEKPHSLVAEYRVL
jgi:hypothetical protein